MIDSLFFSPLARKQEEFVLMICHENRVVREARHERPQSLVPSPHKERNRKELMAGRVAGS